jgi:uncharacterized protein YxjI
MKNFYLKQKVFSFKDRYKVYDENEQIVYHCEGTMFSFRQPIKIIDSTTNEHLYTLTKKVFSFLPTYYLQNPNGIIIGTLKKEMKFLKHSVEIDVDGVGLITIEGNLFAHTFSALQNDQIIMTVQKKVFSIGDSYEITIDETLVDVPLMIAVSIMIDHMLHNESKKRNNR